MAEPRDGMKLQLDVEDTRREVERLAPAATAAAPPPDPRLVSLAQQMADQLTTLDPHDAQAQRERRAAVETAGRDLQRRSAHRSKMLEEPIRKLSERGEEGGEVGRALLSLREQIEELDPNRIDLSPGWFGRLLSRLPFVGTPLRRYFSQYESAQGVIDAILHSLEDGREQLQRDNVTLADDQVEMRDLTRTLGEQIQLLRLIDERIEGKLGAEVPEGDPRHRFLKDEILYPLRQRIGDLQQQLAVNQQGVLAIELILRNNNELVRGVNRAIDVTVSALQVAVTVALALAHQRIVLDKIEALNETTSTLLAGTAARLRTQGGEIHKQASSSMLDLEALKSAFTDITAAMDEISRFRGEALPVMANTIQELGELSARGEAAIEKLEQGRETAPLIRLELEPTADADR